MNKAPRREWTLRRIPPRTRDDTRHLLASPENARRLLSAIREAEQGEGIPVASLRGLREQLVASRA